MFVDLWLNFCCARKQKQEIPDQPLEVKEEQNDPPIQETIITKSPVEQRVLQSNSQELKQKLQDIQKLPKGQVKTSLEMEVEPVDGFLALSGQNSNKMASWEALELSQRQNDVMSQLAQFAILAKSVSSNNGQISNFGSGNMMASDKQILSGSFHQQPFDQNLAQTQHLGTIEEYPTTQMIKSQSQTSLNGAKIEKKRIQKEKKQKDKKSEKKEVIHAKLWDKSEDAILRQAYHKFQGNWREIASQLPGRNMNQCSQRWRRINPQENGKKKWTFDEDNSIIQLVQKHDRNWAEIAKHFPGKTGKQIRERYLNKLDPNISKQAWTKDEDEIILKVYKEHGPKWSIASKQLKGRPENTVKNRFYSYIRRVVLGQQNPYSIVLNNGDLQREDNNTISQDSESIKQPLSMDQTPSFTGSSYFSSFLDEDYMEEEEDQDGHQDGQFKI